MTNVERMMAVIRGERTDKIPKGEFYIEDELVPRLLQLTQVNVPEEIGFSERVKACEILGLDALVFNTNSLSQKDNWQELSRWRRETDLFLFAIVDGPFQGVAHTYPNFTDFLLDTVQNGDKISGEAREIIRLSREKALRALEAGAHGIMIGDDIAYHQGLYIAPRHMRQLFFPPLAELVHSLTEQGRSGDTPKTPLFFHSDGNLLQILKEIHEMGFDGLHSLEPVMDLDKVREITGPEFCLMGGFDLGWFNSEGIDHAEKLIVKAAKGNPYIFGSSAGILDANLPAEEVLKVYRYVEEYPL